MIAIAVASGAMAVAAPVYADSAADGSASGSPGVISGNDIQLPVHLPVSVCGNTVNVVGLLNPAMGNRCANVGDDTGKATGAKGATADKGATSGGATSAGATSGGAKTPGGAEAVGSAQGSPGVLSGNGIQLPVHLPVNISGNSVNVVGVGNPVFGNESVNASDDHPEEPKSPTTPSPEPPTRVTPPVRHLPPATHPAAPKPSPVVVRQRTAGTLAHTGGDAAWAAAGASVASLMGGTVLYRRFRSRPAGREG
ncbi:chaplin [Streptomyces sp. 5-8]|uniref:Chaplin n=1 Tax=Streptomyces musisoli TaxID=2802280 RepID=A0ABS1NUW9_9ACTN|nr:MULTISPECIES: chaplin [Streptomyces]MBL1103877.1 chaplin [Streptomyces musisoli]MBY8843918.1 chaplin [Streptomyces sp. SP2-10]